MKSRARRRFIFAVCRNDVHDIWILPQRGGLTPGCAVSPGQGREKLEVEKVCARVRRRGRRNSRKVRGGEKEWAREKERSLPPDARITSASRARVSARYPRPSAPRKRRRCSRFVTSAFHCKLISRRFPLVAGEVRPRNDREDKMRGRNSNRERVSDALSFFPLNAFRVSLTKWKRREGRVRRLPSVIYLKINIYFTKTSRVSRTMQFYLRARNFFFISTTRLLIMLRSEANVIQLWNLRTMS